MQCFLFPIFWSYYFRGLPVKKAKSIMTDSVMIPAGSTKFPCYNKGGRENTVVYAGSNFQGGWRSHGTSLLPLRFMLCFAIQPLEFQRVWLEKRSFLSALRYRCCCGILDHFAF